MLRPILMLSILLFVTSAAQAETTPLAAPGPTLAGYQIGMDFEEALQIRPLEQVQLRERSEDGRTAFAARFRTGERDETGYRGHLVFIEGELEKIFVSFPGHETDHILHRLKQVYGQPFRNETVMLTPIGIELDGRYCNWLIAGQTVELTFIEPLRQIQSQESNGFIALTTESYQDYLQQSAAKRETD